MTGTLLTGTLLTGTLLTGTGPRLLHPGPDPVGLAGHTARYGPVPSGLGRREREALIAEVDRAGLTGRGGAGFPTARKLAAVAAGRTPVVVVNGTEGEPASVKDRVLMARSPHLVLDGAVLAAEVTGARTAVIVAHRDVREFVAEAGGSAARLTAPGRVGVAEAGPVVRGHQPGASGGAAAEPDGEAGALGGVREHVSQQVVDAGGQVIRCDEDRYWLPGHLDGHPALLVFRERPPERGPFGDHPGRVADSLRAASARPPGLPDDLADRPLHRADVGEQPLHLGAVPQRLGVDPQRRQRGPQLVGGVGDGLPLVGEKLADADRQAVQPGTRPPDLRRAGDRGPGRQVSGGQAVGGLRQRGERADQGPGQLVSDQHAEQEQEEADSAEQQPGPADAVPQHRGGHEGADHGRTAREPLHRHQHLLSAGSLGREAPAAAGQAHRGRDGLGPAELGARRQEDRDRGTGFRVDLIHGEPQAAGRQCGDQGASDWASAAAALVARSAARVRSTRASGTRKDTRTRELVATTSRLTRSLTAAGSA